MSENKKWKMNKIVWGILGIAAIGVVIYLVTENSQCGSARQRVASLNQEYQAWFNSMSKTINSSTNLTALKVSVANNLASLASESCPVNDDITAARQLFSNLETTTASAAEADQQQQQQQNPNPGLTSSNNNPNTNTGYNNNSGSNTNYTTTTPTTPQTQTTYNPPQTPAPTPPSEAEPTRISLSGFSVELEYCDHLDYVMDHDSNGFLIPSSAQRNAVLQIHKGKEAAYITSYGPTNDGLSTKQTSCLYPTGTKPDDMSYDISFSSNGSGPPLKIAWGNYWVEVHRSGNYIYLTTVSGQ